ncbi:flavodoxin [Bacteroidota bacterium]
MKKIGLIYSFNTQKTSIVAEKIFEEFKTEEIEKVNAEELTEEEFMKYDNLILGSSTWFDGELPNYWDEFLPALEDLNLKEKTIAIFGTGNQRDYPENFVDAIGILGNLVENLGATLIGITSTEGYSFESSKGLRNNKFMGLAIDQDTEAKKTAKRVKDWVAQLKKEFK